MTYEGKVSDLEFTKNERAIMEIISEALLMDDDDKYWKYQLCGDVRDDIAIEAIMAMRQVLTDSPRGVDDERE